MTAVGAGLNAAVIAVGASQTGKSYTMGTTPPTTAASQQVYDIHIHLHTSQSLCRCRQLLMLIH